MRPRFKSELTHGPAPLHSIVLAGDPEEDSRLILLSALTHAGYRVRLAGTAQELFREALGDGVDLVICPIHLPAPRENCAIHALKRLPELRHIPVIGYSESPAPGDEALACSVGADAFLPDPANLVALFDTVASTLAASRSRKGRARANAAVAYSPESPGGRR